MIQNKIKLGMSFIKSKKCEYTLVAFSIFLASQYYLINVPFHWSADIQKSFNDVPSTNDLQKYRNSV
jgi:hypothetical protein